MNVNDCFSHELGGDTLNEYIYSNVKKKTKEDFFPFKNSEDLIGEEGDNEGEEEVIPNNMIKYYASEILPETTNNYADGLHTNAFDVTITSHTFEDGVGIIEFEEDINLIGDYAFRGCNRMTKIKLPNSVTSISTQTFYNCTSLTSITIPDSVTSIGNSAFSGCHLVTLVVPSSVVSIGTGAFSGVVFENVTFNDINPDATFECDEENKILVNKSHDTLITGFNNGVVVVPNTIHTIGQDSFNGCTSLTSITIPDSVTSIDGGAFNGCSGLTSITIPNTVTTIEGGAFGNSGITSIVIPSSMSVISGGAFDRCGALLEVTIPSSITSIQAGAFSNCTSLTSITSLATTAPSVQNNAFGGSGSNGTLTVPSGATGYDAWMEQLPSGWTIVEQ